LQELVEEWRDYHSPCSDPPSYENGVEDGKDDCARQLAACLAAEGEEEPHEKSERVFQAVVYAYEGREVPRDLEEHGMVKRARKYRQALAAKLAQPVASASPEGEA
jgi:hypothetical protein